uniref:Centrosomal protein of 85 kDa-like n=1 Tax=Petromyzon marinus TaxID=7757 RepID=A0AAJ7U6S2_PETMA|nr:centrosomal protein of 85 kDa-like [Petromyzon marinus]
MWSSKQQQQPGVDGFLAGGRRGVDNPPPAGTDMEWQDLERIGVSTGTPRAAGVSFGGPSAAGGARDGDMEWQDPEGSGVSAHRANATVGSPDSGWSVDAVGGPGWGPCVGGGSGGVGGGSGGVVGTPSAWTGGPTSRQASVTSESGDTGVCFSDGTEDRCSVSSGSSGFSFKPIRSLAPIPTAHVMPSATLAGTPPSPPSPVSPGHLPCGRRRSRTGAPGPAGRPLRAAWDPEASPAAPSSRAEREGRPGKERASRSSLGARGVQGPGGETASQAGAGLHRWSSLTRLHGAAGGAGGGGGGGGGSGGEASDSTLGGRGGGDESSETELAAPASRSAGGVCSPAERDAGGTDSGAWPPGATVDEAGVAVWQQQQLEELRRHVSDLQLMNGSARQQDAYPGLPLSALAKWDALLKMKETLLQEKDLAIEKQKQQLLLLQRRVQETEARLQALVLPPPSARPGWLDQAALSLHLQESQLESASLRAQLSERAGALVAAERGELERRLADAEARARAAGEAASRGARQHAESLARVEEKLRHRDKQLSSMRKRVEREAEARAERARRVESLETYLADLPTLEHHQALRLKLEQAEARAAQLEGSTAELQAQLRERDSRLRERDSLLDREVQTAVAQKQAELEGRAAEMERALRERETEGERRLAESLGELRSLRQREQELVATVQTLQQKVERCLSDGARLPVLGLESLQRDNQRLRDDCERARKIMENQQRRLDALAQQRSEQEAAERERAGGAERQHHALRLLAAEHDARAHELLVAVKALTAEKEGLFSRCLELQERLEGAAGPGDEGPGEVVAEVVAELCAAQREMRVLCDVMTARAQGRQPDLSQLLGLHSGPAVTAAEEASSTGAGAWAATRSRACRLRADVEALRAVVADRCAQDVGDNCITQ